MNDIKVDNIVAFADLYTQVDSYADYVNEKVLIKELVKAIKYLQGQ